MRNLQTDSEQAGSVGREAHQFLRFVIVGVTAFAVDTIIHYLLVFVIRFEGRLLSDSLGELLTLNSLALDIQASPNGAAFAFLKLISTTCGVLVSFYLNRKWTFANASQGASLRQFKRYVNIVVVGLVLNTAISSGLNAWLPFTPKIRWVIATVVATALVSVWNYNGHKRWSFAPSLAVARTRLSKWGLAFRWATLGLVALGILAAILSLGHSTQHDGPVVMYPAWLVWTKQKNLYQDLFDFNLPGTYGIYGLIVLLTDFQDLRVQLLHITLLCVLALLGQHVAGPGLHLASLSAFGVYLAILFADPISLSLQREFFILLLAVGAVAVLMNLERSAVASLWIGVMGGYAMLIKPHAVVIFLMVLWFRVGWAQMGERARSLGGFALGSGLTVAVAIATVALSGGLSELALIVKDYVPLYGEMTGGHEVLPPGERMTYILTNIAGNRFAKVVFALAILGHLMIVQERKEDVRLAKLSIVLVLIATCCLFYPALSGQFWKYHYLPFFYFGAFSVSVSMYVLIKRQQKVIWTLGYLLAAFVALWSVALGTLRQLKAGHRHNSSALMIRDYLRDNLQPGETVQPLDWTVGCVDGMLRARAPLATRFIYDFSFYHHVSSETIQRLRRRFIEELDASRPAVILQAYGARRPWPSGVDTTRRFPELELRLRRDYKIAKQDDEVRILIRRDRFQRSVE